VTLLVVFIIQVTAGTIGSQDDLVSQKRAGTSCTVPGVGSGTCQNVDTAACSGNYYSGYCPGASNIRCCATSQSSSSPPLQQPRSSGSTIICSNPERYQGQALCHRGTYCGECVSFVKVCTGDNRVTGQWVMGRAVKGASLQRGTCIATFPDAGKYRGHAAVYLSQNSEGIQVWDQWKGHPVSPRTIRWNGSGLVNNGNNFYVIEGTPMFSAVGDSATAFSSDTTSPAEERLSPIVVGVIVGCAVIGVLVIVVITVEIVRKRQMSHREQRP